jgi:hypothetical protein
MSRASCDSLGQLRRLHGQRNGMATSTSGIFGQASVRGAVGWARGGGGLPTRTARRIIRVCFRTVRVRKCGKMHGVQGECNRFTGGATRQELASPLPPPALAVRISAKRCTIWIVRFLTPQCASGIHSPTTTLGKTEYRRVVDGYSCMGCLLQIVCSGRAQLRPCPR